MITEQKEPDEFLKSLWALNDKYPDYVGCTRFDGASFAFHDMQEVKKEFKRILLKGIEKEIASLSERIEIAQENGESIWDLLSQRKNFRTLKDIDISTFNTIEELHAIIPETLKPYWRKNG